MLDSVLELLSNLSKHFRFYTILENKNKIHLFLKIGKFEENQRVMFTCFAFAAARLLYNIDLSSVKMEGQIFKALE